MNFRRLTATAVLVIAAMGVGAGASAAAPEPAAAPQAIGYQTKLVDKTVVTTLVGGTFAISSDGKTVDIKDTKTDKTAVSLPLALNLENVSVPLVSSVKNDGRTLELTPQPVAAAAGKNLLVKPVASTIENQAAMSAFGSQLGIATAIGGLAGTAIGAVVGCLVGLPGLVTCIPAAITGAGIGGIIGTIVAGGPTLLVAGIDLINTLNAPPGTTKFADQLPK